MAGKKRPVADTMAQVQKQLIASQKFFTRFATSSAISETIEWLRHSAHSDEGGREFSAVLRGSPRRFSCWQSSPRLHLGREEKKKNSPREGTWSSPRFSAALVVRWYFNYLLSLQSVVSLPSVRLCEVVSFVRIHCTDHEKHVGLLQG